LRAGLDGPATPTLAGQRFRLPGEDGAPGFGGFPPIRQKNGEWMGHGKVLLQSVRDLFPAFLRRGRNDLVSDGQRGGLRADYAGYGEHRDVVILAEGDGGIAGGVGVRTCRDEIAHTVESEKLSGGIAGLKQSIGVERQAISGGHREGHILIAAIGNHAQGISLRWANPDPDSAISRRRNVLGRQALDQPAG